MWFAFATLSALCSASGDLLAKLARRKFSRAVVIWFVRLCATTFNVAVAWAVTGGFTKTGAVFWKATAASAVINTAASLMYIEAISLAPVSLVAPVMGLTPVFILATGPFITGEPITAVGVAGAGISLLGAYFLGISAGRFKGWSAPLRNLWKARGARMMLGTAALWSFSSPLDKIASVHGSSAWYPAFLNGALSLTLLPFLFVRREESVVPPARVIPTSKDWLVLAFLGMVMASNHLFQMQAFAVGGSVGYVMSVKRLSAAFAVFLGWLLLRESVVRARFIGAVLICLGAAVILIGGH